MLFHIAQIPRMPRFLGSRLGTMVARLPDMKVFTGAHTTFPSQISCLVNVEAVFSFGQLRKDDFEACSMAAQGRHSFPLDLIGLKDSDGGVHYLLFIDGK